jgi:hypothetical protein
MQGDKKEGMYGMGAISEPIAIRLQSVSSVKALLHDRLWWLIIDTHNCIESIITYVNIISCGCE